jgi:hypothetical protein
MAEKKKQDKPAARGTRKKAAAAESAAAVVNANNEKVGEVHLSPAVFGAPINEHLLYEAVPCRGSPRDAHDEEPRAGLRLGPEALAPEGHRTCAGR